MPTADEIIQAVIVNTMIGNGQKEYNKQVVITNNGLKTQKQLMQQNATLQKQLVNRIKQQKGQKQAIGMFMGAYPALQKAARARRRIAAGGGGYNVPLPQFMQQGMRTGYQAPTIPPIPNYPMGAYSNIRTKRLGNVANDATKIDWIPSGSSKFIPKAKPQQKVLEFQQTRMGKTLKKVNMNLFKLQMASLGVYFSFMGIEKGITGLFSSLQDLGGTFKAGALGKAFGGVDVAGTMGVGGGEMVQGWKNITGIMSMITSATSALAAMTLTPEVMSAIKDMFTALATALSDGKVAKALGEIIIAFTDLVKSIVESGLLGVIADLIVALGDSGLLAPIIGLVLGAQYLLAALSLLGFAGQAITLVIEGVAAVAAFLGVTFGTVIVIIGAVLFVVDLLINIWENFCATGDIVGSIVNGLIDTFIDFYNVLLPILNLVGGFVGWHGEVAETKSGSYAKASVTNNYNFNGNYDDPSALIKKTQKAKATSY